MTLGARRWTGRFFDLLCLVMATLTVLMVGILLRESFPLGFVLMAFSALLPAGLTLLPGVVALHTIALQRVGMLLMGERNFTIRNIEDDLLFLCEGPCNKQKGKQKANKDSHTHQPLTHS